jgi:Holliday junction DNA helicase RuvA
VISQLRGTIVEKTLEHVVLDVGGVGYHVFCSLNTLAELPEVGVAARLFTVQQVRAESLKLFGFSTVEEREAFELATSVQGIGGDKAMSLLSQLAPPELAEAVRREDVARLKRVPGIGQKTAERLVLELRSKFGPAAPLSTKLAAKPGGGPVGDRLQVQVAGALVNLGYKPPEAERAAESALAAGPHGSMTDLVKRALRALAE